MLWQTKQNFSQKILAKLYKIQPELLSINNHLAWTNLGCWYNGQHDYVAAAQQLAQHMGQALALTEQDQLLDIGCGYGASLVFWHTTFGLNHLAALELQPSCCAYLQQKKLNYVDDIFQQSCFEAKPEQCKHRYDVIVSIDATYHYALQDYLASLEDWLTDSGRVGFHLLIKSAQWQQASFEQQQSLSQKLKWAKVEVNQILTQEQVIQMLEHQGYIQIEIQDLTTQVLQGFADYIQHKTWSKHEKFSIGFLKIYFTARLCRALVQSQLIQYVQVTAQKKAIH